MPRTEIEKSMSRIPEEIYNHGRLELAEEIFAADYIEHIPLPPDFPKGIPGLKAFVTMVRAAFPDFRYRIEDVFTSGDKMAMRVTAQGTHRGDFMGIAASGKQVSWTEIHIVRIQGGKLVEHWANLDQLGMLQQMGAIPSAAPA